MKIQFDRGNYKIVETGEGFVKAKITLALPGTFPYLNEGEFDDGRFSYIAAKLPEELFSADTIASAQGAPITDQHPENKKLVTSDNYTKYVKGTVSSPRVENGELTAYATIYDKGLIHKLLDEKKQRQVSIGFVYNLDGKSGLYEGKEYDVVQRNIRINHVAMVDQGRAGERAKIHIDHKEKIMEGQNIIAPAPEGQDKKYSYRMMDGATDIQVDGPIHQELMALRKQIKNDSAEIDNLKTQIEQKVTDEKINDELRVAKDEAEQWKNKFGELKKSIPEMVAKAAMDRLDLVDIAKSVCADQKFSEMSDKDIRIQVIQKGLPFKSGIAIDGVSDFEIDARFDAAVELLKHQANKKEDKPQTAIDENTINEKRLNMQNLWIGGNK